VGPVDTARAFDLNLTNVRHSLTKYAAIGARALFWPEGANPALFRPLPVERTHDVAFVGGRYGPRGPVVERLQRLGFSVLARGPGWPEGPVPAEEIPVVLNRGRVVLGFSGIGRSMRVTCLKGRDFEAPACGAAYLASWNPELPLVWNIGKEIGVWRDVPDLVRTMRSLLQDDDALQRMRAAAVERSRSHHTWAKRVEAITQVLGHSWRAG
jgi:spore maturation protein CgeB